MPSTATLRTRLVADAVAGLSVALVLVPQSLAYAELAGLPAQLGLVAAVFPPLAAALLASSPFLQTGPTALTSILAFGVLSAHFVPGSPEYVAAAALLALVVGLARIGLGALRMGNLAYFMSRPVLQGFTSAAAVLILASQVPPALGLTAPTTGIFPSIGWALRRLDQMPPLAALLALGTVAVMVWGNRIHPRFPGALAAVVVGTLLGAAATGVGPVVGAIPVSIVVPSFALPWQALPELLVGGVVIAAVGFAEPASIARMFARRQARPWNPDRELIAQGAANLAAGVFGAFPVGGSFSRSALNVSSGALTRWSGFFTGLVVLAFLPVAGILASLPKAVLAGIVIAAVMPLLAPLRLLLMWRFAKWQAMSAYATFVLTLVFAPRIDVAVLAGVAVAVVLHLWRETQLAVDVERDGDTMTLRLSGVLFFGSTHHLAAAAEILPAPEGIRRLVIDGTGLGRVDLTGNMALNELIRDAEFAGLEVEVQGLERYMQRVLRRVRHGMASTEGDDTIPGGGPDRRKRDDA